jgi:hypothetical protein
MGNPISLFRQLWSVVLGYKEMNLASTSRIPAVRDRVIALNDNGFDLNRLQP